MHRFFVDQNQISNTHITITGADVNHMKNVLRMKAGEPILVSDREKYEYRCAVSQIEKNQIVAEIQAKTEGSSELPVSVYLFQGLPKSDKMEWIIQKAVELGVQEIIPVVTKRTVVKLDQKKEAAKQKRWNSISESAAKQSGRVRIPLVKKPMDFNQALSYAGALEVKLIPYECASDMEQTRKLVAGIDKGSSVGIFIGPEGGFEEQEIQAAKGCGIVPVTLGRRILRTETAGLAVLSVLMYQLEE